MDIIQLSDKETQLIAKCLEELANINKEDILGLFLKRTGWSDELCDLTHKLTKIYPYVVTKLKAQSSEG